ncbi:MAG: amidohydrolase [Oscillospiraceae bacterium]|jgi:5-methylthioadenosine/S-adenosylhomocysteine deaminase|nr:amidohydrolase [Oscillospiraceae bacterium]
MSILFKKIQALLPDGGGLRIETCNVGVAGNTIAFVGEVPEDFVPDETIDGKDRLLTPGFVNAHTHAYMTLLRNRADDLPFHAWLFDNILPMEDRLRTNDSYWGTFLAAIEMLRSGCTCYNDMYISQNENAQAAHESGMRAVLSRGLVGSSRADEGGLRRLREASDEIAAFRGYGRLTFALAPHAPYTCAPDYLSLIAETARKLDVPIHTHLGESRQEIADIQKLYGKTPFALMEDAGVFNVSTIAAHCVHMTEQDMRIAAQHGVSVATNPISNLKLANGVAPVREMIANGINVALGTDGAASNNALNMLRELNFLCLIHKGKNEDSVCITAEQGLKIATINGANALGLGAITGSIEAGKRADLVVCNLNQPHWTPRTNLLAALCYGAQGNEPEKVFIDGELLFANGHCAKIDEERVCFEAQKISERL